MINVAYDITSLAQSPHGGIARVCYHTVRQAHRHPEVAPTAWYRSGERGNLDGLEVDVRRINPFSSILSPRYDIAHSLCHRTLNVRAKKSVYQVHDIWSLRSNPYQSPAFQKKLGKRMREDIARADFIVTDSENTRNEMLALNLVPPDRCLAVHLGCGIEPERSSESSVPMTESLRDKAYVLFVGCLEVRKNLGHVLNAVRPLQNVHLVLAAGLGYGYEDKVKPALAAFPQERLHHFRAVNPGELSFLYRNAAAMLLPSWEEGFGLPIIEAMANQCPVITSNRSANAEVGGEAAVLVDPENPDDSRRAIERFVEDADFRRRTIEAGKKRAQLFTWDGYYEKLVGVYRQLLSG